MTAEREYRTSAQSGLRARAEVAADSAPEPRIPLTRNTGDLIRELRVHEIELEMQADELRRAYAHLEESRNRYHELYEFAPIGYLTLDARGVVTQANRACESILGLPRSHFVGSPLSRFILPEDATVLHLHRKFASGTGDANTGEVRIVQPDGSLVYVQLRSVPAETPQGYCRTALIDVSERKRTEQSLAERTEGLVEMNGALMAEIAERSRAQRELAERETRRKNAELALERQRGFADRLIEAVPALVLSLGCEGHILGFNSRMAELSGYSLDEIIGQDWLEQLVTEEARGEVRDAFAHALRGGRPRELVAPMLSKSGALRQIQWHFATMESQTGETSGLVALGQDVTDRHRAEQELRQANKMEAVGTLASGIAHDLNNVLAGIIGCSDVALGRLDFESPVRVPVEQAKSAALGGAQVIHRLMAFASRQPTERKVVDINSLIGRLDAMLRHLLGEDVEFLTSLRAENANVACQADELEQVFMNLCVNARHAMPLGGTLTVYTREVRRGDPEIPEIPAHEDVGYVAVEVTDTGSGMDEKTRERLFEPFFTTRPAGQGTGLGLSSVYATVHHHGGHIRVSSELGKGTTFVVYLPQSSEPAAPPSIAPEAPLSSHGGGETVLVVEDEPLVRLAMRHYLERRGYQVLEAAHHREVSQILARHEGPIDVLLTDTVLPGKSGTQIAAMVHAARPSVQTVYVSGHSNVMLVSDGRIPAGTPTLQKPFTEAALISRIREALSRSQVPSESGIRKPAPRPRLLLVEDHADIRATLADLLAEFGYEVMTAENGASALSQCEQATENVDLLVTDITLPDVGGLELTKRIRHRFTGIGVLMVSGKRPEDIPGMAQALREPRTAFLQKPMDFDRLSELLVTLVQKPKT
jgi:PAS domain S-box-containing protein